MNREQKIQLLEAVTDGKLMPEDFRPLIGLCFIESDTPGVYQCNNGKQYKQKELDAYKQEFYKANQRRMKFGLMHGFMSVVFSSIRIDKTQQSNPEPVQTAPIEREEITEDTTAIIETVVAEKKNTVKPDKIIKPKTFNLRGEEVDRQRAEKMDQFKSNNSTLYE